MNNFKLSGRSLKNLEGVHADLQAVVKLAITFTEIDFAVVEGKRTLEKQKQYLAAGATTTLKSRHIDGCAVDLGAFLGREYLKNAAPYHKLKDAMFKAAKQLGIPLRWGGDWDCAGDSGDERFFDGPHFELPRGRKYP